MLNPPALADLSTTIQVVGTICQMATAIIAAGIGVTTFLYTRRQSALALVNQNNTLANLVNSTIIQSEHARETFGKLHDFIVGCPDDAVLFMYFNYVHNAYRMHQIGAVSDQVWNDTLSSCVNMICSLRRDQVDRLLSRGYEAGFRAAVLARYDAIERPVKTDVLTTLRPRRTPVQVQQTALAS